MYKPWNKPKKPLQILAPIAGFTDSSFRRICLSYGADVVYTELASVAGLTYAPAKTLKLLTSHRSEQPLIIQLFGAEPKQFANATKLLMDLKKCKKYEKNYRLPAGIDINFGCPVTKVTKQGAGSALFQDLKRSREVITAVLANTTLPVSIKIRSGAGRIDCLEFLDYMKDLDIKTVMIHGRRLEQVFSGPVDYAIMKEARQHFKGLIIANGGINDLNIAKEALKISGADGLGWGRAVLSKPWLIAEAQGKKIKVELLDLKKLMIRHAKLVQKERGSLISMRAQLAWYAQGWPKAKEVRPLLVKVNDMGELKSVLRGW